MTSRMRRWGWAIAVLGLMAGPGSRSEAGQILGGSSLVDATSLARLEAWLGEGELDLTNIFSHAPGDGKTSVDFHAAADGQGRTFSVIEVLAAYGHQYQVIGGYNPRSWRSDGGYNVTDPDAERTAFLFNLTSGELQRQKLNSADPGGHGRYQTLNNSHTGPTFGESYDILIGSQLDWGSTYNSSYGSTYPDDILLGNTSYNDYLVVGRIEVFTIAPAAAVAAPEPSTLALAGTGALAGLGAWRRKRRRAAA